MSKQNPQDAGDETVDLQGDLQGDLPANGTPGDPTRLQIMVVVDGSGYSESVCDHAVWIAKRADADVRVVHVLGRSDGFGHGNSDGSDLSGNIGLGARSSLLGELAELDVQRARLAQKRGRAILQDAEARIIAAGVPAVQTRLRHGEIVETVKELESDVGVIVMGKRGEDSNMESVHIGSNLERVARYTRKPLLIASRAFRPIKRMLLAFDGGKSAMQAIDFIAARPHYNDLLCHLVTVGTDNAATRRVLEGAAAVLRNAGFEVEIEIIAGEPEKMIAEVVETRHIDLLIIGAYGHSRIRNLIIGSTTTALLASCRVPVLLFR